MKLSRVLGLPMAFLVLQLGFIATEARCRPGHQSGHEHHGAESTQQQSSTPAIPLCCQALGSCAATLDLGQAREDSLHAGPASRSLQMVVLAPSSLDTAPEAPPPRA